MSRDWLIDLDSEFEVAHKALSSFEQKIRPRVSQPIWEAPKPIIGVLRVEYDGRGLWLPFAHSQHVSGGVLSLIIAVRAADDEDDDITHPSPGWCALWGPALIDMVAVPLAAPHRWARRTGLARTLGRIPFLEPRAAVQVHRSPASWLKGDGRGIAILERERAAVGAILRSCTGGIEADDANHARELRAIGSWSMQIPPIRPAASAIWKAAL